MKTCRTEKPETNVKVNLLLSHYHIKEEYVIKIKKIKLLL